MADTDAGGLRERKKRATQHAIERGAIELALEHGYDNVTVEMICDSAMISQRTFFNYAGSKERAVLGIDIPLAGEELRRAYLAGRGGSPLEDLVTTVASAFSDFGGDNPELFTKRRHIIRTNPGLAIKQFARMEEAQNSILALVRERLRADDPGRDDGGLDDEARMVVALAFGLMHYIVHGWIADGFPGEAAGMLAQALQLARQVVST